VTSSVVSHPLSENKKHNYRELRVWVKAIDFTRSIYKATKNFPKDEVFGLCSQLKRAAVSIPSNIAEGSVKRSDKDFSRFLNIAFGSIAEVDTQLVIAEAENFISKMEAESLFAELYEIRKMLSGLMNSLKSDN